MPIGAEALGYGRLTYYAAMAEQLSLLFRVKQDRPSFEDLGRTYGGKFWYARDFMKMIGYESFQSFLKAINKATATCLALNISVTGNFAQVQRPIDDEQVTISS